MSPHLQSGTQERWSSLPAHIRKDVFETIAQILARLQSGVVVGGSGMGKSNVSTILATRPDIMNQLLPKAQSYLFCRVDFNRLPRDSAPSFLYRMMLRALYKAAQRAKLPLAQEVYRIEIETRRWEDDLSWFFALEDAHQLLIGEAQQRVVWIFDRFDDACEWIDDNALDPLRSLRDETAFFGKLHYLLFTRKPLTRLRAWQNSEFLEIVESNTCWIKPMGEEESQWVVQYNAELANTEIPPIGEECLFELSGGHPTFLRTGCHLWIDGAFSAFIDQNGPGNEEQRMQLRGKLLRELVAHEQIRRTCIETMEDLEPDERQTLMMIASGRAPIGRRIDYLLNQGLVIEKMIRDENGRHTEKLIVFSPVLTTFLNQLQSQKPRFLSTDSSRMLLVDGISTNVRLKPYENKLFQCLLKNANQAVHHDKLVMTLYSHERLALLSDPKAAMQKHWNSLKIKLRGIHLESRLENPGAHLYKLVQPELPSEYGWLQQDNEVESEADQSNNSN